MDEANREYQEAVDQSYADMAWTFSELVGMAREVASRKSGLSEFCLCRTDRARVRRMVVRIRERRAAARNRQRAVK